MIDLLRSNEKYKLTQNTDATTLSTVLLAKKILILFQKESVTNLHMSEVIRGASR